MAGLVADYNSDSDDQNSGDSSSESEDTDSDEQKHEIKIDRTEEKLPLPDILSDKPQSTRTDIRTVQKGGPSISNSSVFYNPFKAKEDKKLAILEKHVKLTERKDERKAEKVKFRRSKRVPRRQNSDEQKNGDDDGFKTLGKRRVGVSDSLIPPKKALQAYEKQRREETRK